MHVNGRFRTREFLTSSCAVLALLAAGCAPHDPRADTIVTIDGDPARGQTLFRDNCTQCHAPGNNGHLAGAMAFFGPTGTLSIVIDGVPGSKMNGYPQFTDRQLADLYAFMRTFKK
jgi:mono/diheme cytochrome c family protein